MQTGQVKLIGMKNVNKLSDPEFYTSDSTYLTAVPKCDKKGNKTGKAVLTAYNTKQDDITLSAVIGGITYTTKVRITPPVVKKAEVSVKVGSRKTIGLKNTKIKKKDIEWISEDPEVAQVEPGGKVTGVSAGTATIYTMAGGVRNECKVTVY